MDLSYTMKNPHLPRSKHLSPGAQYHDECYSFPVYGQRRDGNFDQNYLLVNEDERRAPIQGMRPPHYVNADRDQFDDSAYTHHRSVDLSLARRKPASTKGSSFVAVLLALALIGFMSIQQSSKSIMATAVVSKLSRYVPLQQEEQQHDEKCLSVDRVPALIESFDQVIIVSPAKAAGSTFKGFANMCGGEIHNSLGNNFLNRQSLEHVLTNSYAMPSVIASHMYNAKSLIRLVSNVPRRSLLIYSHREETSRLFAAIRTVLFRMCRNNNSGKTCNVAEDDLVHAIKSREHEIGLGASRILTCEMYQAIKDFSPNMVFMDYKQADTLQSILAEKFCPSLLGETLQRNVFSSKNVTIYVHNDRLLNVTIDDWLQTKSSTIEWSLELNGHETCMGKTRKMEDELFSCEAGFLKQ